MKSWSRVWMSVWMGLCLVALARPAAAQYRTHRAEGEASNNTLPQQLEDVGIEDKAGGDIPRDVKLVHSNGAPFSVGEYMDGDKPLLVVLAYYKCPMLCSLVINGMNTAMKGIAKKTAGKDYRVLVVSFDPRDTSDVAHEKRENYVHDYGRDVDPSGYEFATGNPAEVKRLADALGFRYRWDDKTKQFAHAAGLFVITPNGKLSQVMTGIQFKGDDLDTALDEAAKGTWHSPLKSALLYCFTYDTATGSYVPIVKNIMKVGGAVTVVVLGALLFFMFRRDRSRMASPAAGELPQEMTPEMVAPEATDEPTPAEGTSSLSERATK